jgi:hypothetical protein
MILEIAQIDVKSGMEADFETGVAKAVPIFQRAKGCKSFEVQQAIELPSRYPCSFAGRRWKIIRSISAAPPTTRNGASWSAIASPNRRT